MLLLRGRLQKKKLLESRKAQVGGGSAQLNGTRSGSEEELVWICRDSSASGLINFPLISACITAYNF